MIKCIGVNDRSTMPRSFLAFAIATIFPLPFLAMGSLVGGWMIWLALIYITLFIAGVDEFVPSLDRDGSAASDEEADTLCLTLALAHFGLLFVCVWSLAGGSVRLFSVDGAALFVAAGLFMGQVSNSNAHELIHRKARGLRHVGRWIYISLIFGHHASAHPAVHHVYVATPLDPNTSRMNEGFYRFFGDADDFGRDCRLARCCGAPGIGWICTDAADVIGLCAALRAGA
jgi:alkane 1-monooxygenase